LIKEFLTKAQENLQDAEVAFEAGRYNAAANRAYYAAFQAAIATLAEENVRHDKNPHSWVQAQFNERLIKARRYYPSKLSSYLMDMQKIRDNADYKTTMINKKTAKEQLQQSKEFCSHIFSRLQHEASGENTCNGIVCGNAEKIP
jgi:uncharacterized protein (UPF0332 family)